MSLYLQPSMYMYIKYTIGINMYQSLGGILSFHCIIVTHYINPL